jgi:hypothetical protein
MKGTAMHMHNTLRSALLSSVIMALPLGVSCSGGGGPVTVTGVALPASVGINCGQSQTLMPQFQPSNATNRAVTWVSSDPALAEVSPAGSVKMNALGEATITVTTQEGDHKASCTVSTYLGSEERARKAGFDRLSGPVNIDRTIYEVKQESDILQPSFFGYEYLDHTASGSNYILSPSVTDPVLKEELGKLVEHMNNNYMYRWEHELRHGANAKHVWTIRKPQNAWRVHFLDETSANLAGFVLFRKKMLDEYVKQLNEWVSGGKDPKQFQFSSWQYHNATTTNSTPSSAMAQMMTWWDANNDFAGLLSGISPAEASLFMFGSFDVFEYLFDTSSTNYRTGINDWCFGKPNFISCSYDTDEFFQKALSALFTYRVADKDVSLFELMGQKDQVAYVTRLNAKMEEELERYNSGK